MTIYTEAKQAKNNSVREFFCVGEPWLESTFKVGRRKWATLTIVTPPVDRRSEGCIEVHVPQLTWHPTAPKRLNKKELRAYRAGFDAFMAEVERLTGVKMVTVRL
jgi:hypothetical protein